MERRGAFDYIILETSGLADPGNIAPIFWVDDGLGSSIYLDGIVTLVDAKNILLSLNEASREEVHGEIHPTTAHLQISHADVIVINKSDTVNSGQLEYVKDTIQTINGLAKLHVTQYAQVPTLEDFLLDLHAYDGLGSLDTVSKGGHSHLDPVNFPLHSPCNGLSAYALKDNLDAGYTDPNSIHYPTHIPGNLAPVLTLGGDSSICFLSTRKFRLIYPQNKRTDTDSVWIDKDDPRRPRGF